MIHLITEPSTTGREDLALYRSRGGYVGLRQALANGPDWVIAQVKTAGLRGRGGSGKGAPVAPKWSAVATARNATRYVVANGAESSPVSQKDRFLMANYPHRVVEGALVAAAAVRAAKVFFYVRGDSPESLAGMETALAEAFEARLFGPGTALEVECQIQPAIPSYISGEETAVIDALEGLEGLPQPKPAYPEQTGLFGNPTLLQNVETFAAAAAILRHGWERFRSVGAPDCPGTALFTVSGAVQRPGVFELPYGISLSTLLELAGAPARDELTAVLPGGLSSGPLRPDELDVPLTYETLADAGTSLGPAAVVVLGKEDELPVWVAENTTFLARASCGQCRGCKDFSADLASALAARNKAHSLELAAILQHGRGNCGHPTGTARFVLRALQAFPEAWGDTESR